MTSSFDKEKKAIAEINQRYVDAYTKCYDAAVSEIKAQLSSGQTMPHITGIATEHQRDILREEAQKLRAEAMVHVDKIRDHVSRTKVEAPSESATRFITLMEMRDHVSQDDINEAAAAYGSNYSALRALNHVARQHDLAPYEHPIERTSDIVESLTKSIGRYGTDVKSDPAHVAGSMAFINMDIENL